MLEKDLELLEDDIDIVTLTLDNDEVVRCEVIAVFEAVNDIEYMALLPIEGEDAESGQVYIYRYSETEDGQLVLDNIEDDEEFEIASDAFDEMLDEMEFDALDGENEEE